MMLMPKLRKQVRRAMNIAPMVDMMFLLLIFFMYSSVIIQREKKMTIKVPKAEAADVQSVRVSGELIINIDKNHEISLGRSRVNGLEELQALLSRIYEANSGQHIIIRADAEVKCETLIGVMDVCRREKINNISIATLPLDEKK